MEPFISQVKQIYQMLEDEESKFIYLNRLNYLISGDTKYMDKIVETYLPELPVWKGEDQFLAELPPDRPLVLFGAGSTGRRVLPIFQKDRRLIGFCSSTKAKQAEGFLGYPVMSPEELISRKDLTVVVTAVDANKEILNILRESGYPEELVFVWGGSTAVDHEQYFGPEFIEYEPEEVFVDDGCCNLRSCLALREHCTHIKKVYAFEPDPENYQVCLRNMERYGFSEVVLLPFGTWSEQATLHFSMGLGGVSHVNEEGETSIPVKPIDNVVDPKERVTFLKMDIEGSELESLKGARQMIQRDKPKLAICIYHKPEDMTEIPLYIKSLVPEYKFYIRHHSNRYGETVLYAVLPKHNQHDNSL